MNLQARLFQEALQSRYRRGFRFLFSALAFMGLTCASIAASEEALTVLKSAAPLNSGDRAEFVTILGEFNKQDANMEFSAPAVPGDGNCFFWSLLVALKIHKALQCSGGATEIDKIVVHDDVIKAREQFKVLGCALVDWYQVNVKGLKYVRLTPDGQRAIDRLFHAKGIENNEEEKQSTVEGLLGNLCHAYNKLSLAERKAAYREHYEQVCEILAPNNDCTEFFIELYPWERWDKIKLDETQYDMIQWYHVNAIFADRTYFPTDLVDLCAGLEMCSGVDVCLVESTGNNWELHSTGTNLRKPAVYIQIVGQNHYEPLAKVQSNAETHAHYDGNSDLDWTKQTRRIDGAQEGIDLAIATAESERVHQLETIASQKKD